MHDANSFWEDTGNKPEKKPVDENLEDLIKELEDSLLAGSKQVSSQIIREKGKQVVPTPTAGKPQVTKIPDPVSLGGKEGVNISFDHLNQIANLVGELLTGSTPKCQYNDCPPKRLLQRVCKDQNLLFL